jgi:TonB family protein
VSDDTSFSDDGASDVASKDPILRGASWSYQNPANLSAQAHHRVEPTHRIDDVGFRCVLATAAPPLPETGPGVEVLAEASADTLAEERSLPRPIHQVQPDYPTVQGSDNESGTVVLEFTVDERGLVRDPRVVRSSHVAFENSVLTAVRDWRFEPAQRGGEPVSVRVMQEFRFNGNPASPLETP